MQLFLTIVERTLGRPAPTPLHQEAGDQNRLSEEDATRNEDDLPVPFPQADRASDDGDIGRRPRLVES